LVTACTIIARNYLAHARVLAESFLAHHPGGRFTVLLVDDEQRAFDDSRELFSGVRLSDIGFDTGEIGRLAAIYDVTELATAVKPVLLRHLLRSSTDVIYLDPDIKIYGSLDEASRLAREHGIVLTPHTMEPIPRDGKWIDDFHILAAGVYNLGFIAVGSTSNAFIDWWWQRTSREARIDPTRMMFTDQRWVDFVPSFFDHFILKDPTYNVAYWNLHARELTWTGENYLVNGRPLTFFHFSGFDGKRPHLLSKHQGSRPRILLSDRPVLARICQDYQRHLERAGVSEESAVPYGWRALPSGLLFDRHMRRLYREELDAFQEGRGPEPPNPFGPDGRFIEWLKEPVAGGLCPKVPRYLHSIYQDRIDLQRAFPDLAGPDGWHYLEWVRTDGAVQHNIPPALLPPSFGDAEDHFTYVPATSLSPGVNIAGYFRAELGVGEAARLLTAAIEAVDIPHSTLTYDVTLSRKAHRFHDRGQRGAPYNVNVVCVNADQTPSFAKAAGSEFFEGRHTAGYWFWELDRFPGAMHSAFDYVDEVWTATRFVASGIQAIGRRPVYTIPPPVLVPRCSPAVTRKSLRLPDGFLFLFVFDFFSVVERKNPLGLIQAFARAFRSGEGPSLVIKTINGDQRVNELEKVQAASAGRPDVFVIDEYYSAEEKNSLLGLCDCYVSLHRSEGFGLTMAEAMALEKPVIATAYSGNLDFMTPENSFLVDYSKGAVPAGCEPYPEGSPWADPDLEHAAELMRRVYEARDEAARKASQARKDILTRHNAGAAGIALQRRFDEIQRLPNPASASAEKSWRRSIPVGSAPVASRTDKSLFDSLDRATALLTPTSSVAPGRRFRRPLVFLQELLFRMLRPYWWQQRQIHRLLIDSLRDVAQTAGRAALLERQQREAVESLWTAVHALESEKKNDIESLWTAEHSLENAKQVHDDRIRLSDERASAVAASITRLQEGVATFQTSAVAHLQALTEQLASTTRSTTELVQRLYAAPYMQDGGRFCYTDDYGKRVLGFRAARHTDSEGYVDFEDIFRGSEQFIRDRLRGYLALLRRHERVIEIGCGRGELLDLLKEAGIPAVGVDIDESMVRRCRSKGHNVEQVDGLSYLKRESDSSLPAIFAAQVVEHLSYDDFLSFLRLSRTKLKPGGQLIFETVNPHALEAFKTFWTDLTHQRPIFPEVALVWCWLAGFDQAYVIFPSGVGDLELDRRTRGEYGIVATRTVEG
jgi:glycosyltransferase involved in cell wall biosynthesis/SAM-dependent methyltransferase